MARIRVLIIDDSVVIRRVLSDVLGADPQIEVVGTAADGRIGLTKFGHLHPDLVTLDVEMPGMDGIATLKAIRATHPRVPVIMFSTLTRRGAVATLDALAAGASDYVLKPTEVGSLEAAKEAIRGGLLARIKEFCRPVGVLSSIPPPVYSDGVRPPATARPAFTRLVDKEVDILAVGASTGGPNALVEVLSALPAEFRQPVVVVQHMPPLFTRLFAERLATRCHLNVVEAKSGQEVIPGCIYIAPGDYHMVVERSGGHVQIRTHQAEPENSCRPAVDVLFRSVADIHGARTLAVVLTGMGQDGLRGCERIRAVGGQILAQDEASSVVWGMPGFVARAGLADRVVPLGEVATEILGRTRGRAVGPAALRPAGTM